MGKIYNLFSESEPAPSTHSVTTANRLLPLVMKYTNEAITRTAVLTFKMEELDQHSLEFQRLAKECDKAIEKWVQRVHQLGAVAKGLWLVDFDTGDGYLCWCYPESRVEHFHPYDSGYKARKRIG
jgi:hypothetical protein